MGKDSKKHKKEKKHKHDRDKHRDRDGKHSEDKERIKAALAAIDIRASCRQKAIMSYTARHFTLRITLCRALVKS